MIVLTKQASQISSQITTRPAPVQKYKCTPAVSCSANRGHRDLFRDRTVQVAGCVRVKRKPASVGKSGGTDIRNCVRQEDRCKAYLPETPSLHHFMELTSKQGRKNNTRLRKYSDALPEQYLSHSCKFAAYRVPTSRAGRKDFFASLTVPQNSILVCGIHLKSSGTSHEYGMIAYAQHERSSVNLMYVYIC